MQNKKSLHKSNIPHVNCTQALAKWVYINLWYSYEGTMNKISTEYEIILLIYLNKL